ncbi:hypothetical protein [Pseudogulbenkiania subflava]|uniref:Uncharacterized protein n=1 Tax=Pseudogulbenkiania subflava DSM 22618 TaxID=1123014 RepID=A0A1Y6BB25_9NEIS|nr:hypothetical protein [Pseudogulbenkiania subflava]SMF02100.1 hypothetical protein SAMN02745746_00773 [Pseudogulbenkiania subflava DSM 22618]
MLQKLENAYLAILRFVVLAVAGLLLISVGLLGMNALKLMKQEPPVAKAEPKVTSQEIIHVVTAPATPSAPASQGGDTPQPVKSVDPLAADYTRAANAVINFGVKVSSGAIHVERKEVIQVLKNRGKDIKELGHEEAFIKGLADVFEKALTTPSVIRSASEAAPFDVVNRIMENYVTSFNQQIDAVNAKNAQAQQKYLDDKAEGMQSLYYAAGAFGTFLMIVFLSIIIRIERNLRNLERIPAQPKTVQGVTQEPELVHSTAS